MDNELLRYLRDTEYSRISVRSRIEDDVNFVRVYGTPWHDRLAQEEPIERRSELNTIKRFFKQGYHRKVTVATRDKWVYFGSGQVWFSIDVRNRAFCISPDLADDEKQYIRSKLLPHYRETAYEDTDELMPSMHELTFMCTRVYYFLRHEGQYNDKNLFKRMVRI